MKKLNALLFTALILGIAFSSCSKDETPEPTFELSELIGEYEVVGGTDFIACPDGDNKTFKITETQITEGQVDEFGCNNPLITISLDYEFINGNTFDVGLGQYKVTSFDGVNLSLTMTSNLVSGSATMNLKKQ